jgi:hyperosmotically inducible periplasmic protein
MVPDSQLQEEVRHALARDPRVPTFQDIAVGARDGLVTLRGTVATLKQRRAAIESARSVEGVSEVFSELKVRLFGGDVRDDELRGRALQSLIGDARVPADAIDVEVAASWVTLTGEVKHQNQSDAAYEDVAKLTGVGGITNRISVMTPSPTTEP